jgi:Protein of unknown function (DUF3558)
MLVQVRTVGDRVGFPGEDLTWVPGPDQTVSERLAVTPGNVAGGDLASRSGRAELSCLSRPKEAIPFAGTECQDSVLTAAQITQFNIGAQGKQDSSAPLGPACNWNDDAGPSIMTLGVIIVTQGQGLAGIYAQKRTYPFFQSLTDVGGYSGVIALTADGWSQGLCQVSVGVTNNVLVEVSVALRAGAPDVTNPCPRNQNIAAAIVQTLKG